MKIIHQRISHDDDSSIGYIVIDNEFQGFILEDEPREDKVAGETRIPAGTYRVKFREELSGLTKRYRNKFDWFTWHLMLQDVPNFEYVYIHIGNDEEHTDGCLLVGDIVEFKTNADEFLGKSTQAFERVYEKVSAALDLGEPVHIEVRDEIHV
jgi:hypothetical protein